MKAYPPMRYLLILALLCLLSIPDEGSAQGDNRTLDAQQQLVNKAYEASEVGKHGEAVLLLHSAIKLGELNVLYLNLGRALFKAGRCEEALDSYAQALTAPPAPTPPAAEVAKAIEAYRAELAESCPGTVVIQCSPSTLQLQIDGQTHACNIAFSLAPGQHTAEGVLEGQRVEQSFELAAMQKLTLDLKITHGSAGQGPGGGPLVEAPLEDDVGSGLRIAGWSLAGAAVVAAGAGIGLQLSTQGDIDEASGIVIQDQSDLDRFNALGQSFEDKQLFMAVAYSAAGALALTSGVLLYLGYTEIEAGTEVPQTSFYFGLGTVFVRGQF